MKETSPFRAAKIYLHLGTNNINGINLVQDFGFPALLLSSSIFSIALAFALHNLWIYQRWQAKETTDWGGFLLGFVRKDS